MWVYMLECRYGMLGCVRCLPVPHFSDIRTQAMTQLVNPPVQFADCLADSVPG
jgi:hypothetical protein